MTQSNQIVDGSLVITERTIDVKEVIASKNKKLSKYLPRFIISYLRRIIHEKELNKAMYENRDKQGIEFVEAILESMGTNIEFRGLENLTKHERIIIASNHPLGGLDGLALIKTVGSVRPNLKFPVNDILLFIPNLKPLFLPVNKHGRHSTEAIREMETVWASDTVVLFFPSGLASRKIKGKVVDLEWKKTFIQKARQYERYIIPTHISGQNSNFFYRLSKLRKFLHIKANIEMLYLVNEMYKQRNKKLIITFGEPIPYQNLDKSLPDIDRAQAVKKIVYDLA